MGRVPRGWGDTEGAKGSRKAAPELLLLLKQVRLQDGESSANSISVNHQDGPCNKEQ